MRWIGMKPTLSKRFLHMTLMMMAAAGAASAQNSDLGLLLGVISPSYSVGVGPGARVSADAGAACQINYAYQIKGWQAADLYMEFPFFLAGRGNTLDAPGLSDDSGAFIAAITPGLRLKVRLGGRVSFYAAAGGGIGWFNDNEVLAAPGSYRISGNTTVTGAFDVGGGLDFRLTRLLSLRPEIRDLITTHSSLSAYNSHNNPIYAFGLAFHF